MPVQVGFWKDLLQLLQRLCVGEVGWQAGAEQGKAQRWSSAETRKKRRLGKQERLREWKASLKEAAGGADPGTLSADSDQPSAGKAGSSLATQPQAAGKALSWRARLKDTRNSRARMYANRRRAARARVQRTASENLGQPSGGVAGPFAGKRTASETAMAAHASQKPPSSCLSLSACVALLIDCAVLPGTLMCAQGRQACPQNIPMPLL